MYSVHVRLIRICHISCSEIESPVILNSTLLCIIIMFLLFYFLFSPTVAGLCWGRRPWGRWSWELLVLRWWWCWWLAPCELDMPGGRRGPSRQQLSRSALPSLQTLVGGSLSNGTGHRSRYGFTCLSSYTYSSTCLIMYSSKNHRS